MSGEKAPGGMSPGGRLGSDLFSPFEDGAAFRGAFLFFRRRAIKLS